MYCVDLYSRSAFLLDACYVCKWPNILGWQLSKLVKELLRKDVCFTAGFVCHWNLTHEPNLKNKLETNLYFTKLGKQNSLTTCLMLWIWHFKNSTIYIWSSQESSVLLGQLGSGEFPAWENHVWLEYQYLTNPFLCSWENWLIL